MTVTGRASLLMTLEPFMPRTIHGAPAQPSRGLSSGGAAPTPGAVAHPDPWGEDEDSRVRCDVVLGGLRPPNDAMRQKIREKLGRLLDDD